MGGLFLALRERQDRIPRLSRKMRKRSHSFRSLCRTLDLAVEMSGPCRGQSRAMIAVAVGEDLTLDFIEPKLMQFLGYKDGEPPPITIYDLIQPSMTPHHRLWVAATIRMRCLPSRLQHPLRSVEVRHASGFYINMDVNIEWDHGSETPTFQLVFAPCASQPSNSASAAAKDVRFVEQVEHQNAIVVLLDIVEFTKACSELSAIEVCDSLVGNSNTPF